MVINQPRTLTHLPKDASRELSLLSSTTVLRGDGIATDLMAAPMLLVLPIKLRPEVQAIKRLKTNPPPIFASMEQWRGRLLQTTSGIGFVPTIREKMQLVMLTKPLAVHPTEEAFLLLLKQISASTEVLLLSQPILQHIPGPVPETIPWPSVVRHQGQFPPTASAEPLKDMVINQLHILTHLLKDASREPSLLSSTTVLRGDGIAQD